MNWTGHSERKRKPDAYFQYIRAALPSNVFTADFHTYGSTKHLLNTKTSDHKEHSGKWPVLKENPVRRPSFLRLDSQGECSNNDWIHDSSYAVNKSSGNIRTLALFSDFLGHHIDARVRYQKPEPVKPYDSNILSAVKLLCEKSDFLLPCHQTKASVATSDDVVLSGTYPFLCQSKLLPSCTGKTTHHTQPVDLVSSLQFQPEARRDYCRQEFQYDYQISPVSVGSSLPVWMPCAVDLTDFASTFKQHEHENSVNQLSVVSFSSSSAVDNANTRDTRWVRCRSRQPRYNCRRKWLRVYRNTRFRKPSIHYGAINSVATDRITDDRELVNSDVDSNECSDSNCENEPISSDCKHDLQQYISSVHDMITPCDQNDALWVDHCLLSELPLPSSLHDIRETRIQDSCSFASLFFVSGKEMDGSDFCSSDSDDFDCNGFLSPTSACQADDILASTLLSGLPCVPFTDSWVMGCFSDCAPTGFASDFEVYFEDDSRSVPCDYDDVPNSSLGVREANARWNEAYSFVADVLVETSRHNSRMV